MIEELTLTSYEEDVILNARDIIDDLMKSSDLDSISDEIDPLVNALSKFSNSLHFFWVEEEVNDPTQLARRNSIRNRANTIKSNEDLFKSKDETINNLLSTNKFIERIEGLEINRFTKLQYLSAVSQSRQVLNKLAIDYKKVIEPSTLTMFAMVISIILYLF